MQTEMQTPNSLTAQQTLHINPTKEERQPSNARCIIIFMAILFFWFCTIIKVVTDGTIPVQKFNFSRAIDYFEINNGLDFLNLSFTWKFPVCAIISGALAVLYTFVLSEYRGKFIVYIGIFFLCCQSFLIALAAVLMTALLSLITTSVGISGTLLIFLSIPLLFYGGYLVISCRSVRNVGTEAIFEIVRDSCRAVRYRPSISIFTCVTSVMIILVLSFYLYFTKRIIIADCSDGVLKFYIFVHSYCTLVLIIFLANFTHIVISGHIIDWHWSNDRDSNTLTIRHSLERTLKYHMGSVAFFSIPLVPHICSIYQVCRRRDSTDDIFKRYDIFTRVSGQFRAFLSIMDFALIQTSVYGHEGTIAIKAAHDLVSQNNHELFLAVFEVSDKIIMLGLTLLAVPFSVEHIHYSAYSFIIPFYIVLATAVRTLLVDKMIVNSTSVALKEESNSSYMVL